MSKKMWIIFVVVCVVLLGGLVFLSRGSQVDVSNVNDLKIIPANAQNGNIADHTFGNTDSKVVLIEYGDFQCPACQSAYPTIKELTEEYKDRMVFIFRNNPLTAIHPNARAASAAAEAAGLQEKFWEMHDTLYEQQDAWGNVATDKRLSFFEGYAKQIGVKDIEKFKADMNIQAVNDKINFDLALGRKVGVTGTPTILLDGQKIESDTWSSKDKFKAKIEDALK